ncbi:MAG: O-antigen ligase family protein [Elusimicrobia bacterium]|nr:O-antigen ligase family protein [Elusimicrobiota bacterium]
MQPDPFKRLIRWGLCAWGLCQPVSIAGANIATGAVLAGLVGYALRSRSFPALRTPLEKPLGLYLAAALLACVFAQDPGESLRHMNTEVHRVALFYLFSAAFAVEAAPAVLGWWAAGFLVTAVIGLLQVFFWHALGPFPENAGPYYKWCEVPHFWQWIWFSSRAHGTINAVSYGEIMGLALVGGASLVAVRRRLGVAVGRSAMAFCALVCLAWVLSGTRGAWLGALVSLGLLRALLAPRRAVLELAGASLAAGMLVLVAGRMRNAGALDAVSFTCRWELWDVALRMFRDHPVSGVGIHNFGAMFPRYHSVPFLWQQTWGDPHNLWLAQLAERGVVGFTALCLLLGAMIRQSWTRFRRSASFLSLWCLTWLVGFLVMNLTESAFQVAMLWMPTMILYAWMERAEEKIAAS